MAPNVRIWLESLGGDISIPIFLNHHEEPGGLVAVDQLAGIGVTPAQVATYATPGIPGTNLGGISYPPRDVILPLAVLGESEADYRRQVAQLRQLTDPTRGGFYLNATSGDGDTRRLHLICRSGMEDNPERDNTAIFILDCLASQPFAESYDYAELEFVPFGSLMPFIAQH